MTFPLYGSEPAHSHAFLMLGAATFEPGATVFGYRRSSRYAGAHRSGNSSLTKPKAASESTAAVIARATQIPDARQR
jgi:hypothetical protein